VAQMLKQTTLTVCLEYGEWEAH